MSNELKVGRTCPNFKALTTSGPIDFHKWSEGYWTLLFLRPNKFQFTKTESYHKAALIKRFSNENIRLIAFSNSFQTDKLWGDQPNILTIPLSFPIIYDVNSMIMEKFAHNFNDHLNRVYILNPFNEVKQIVTFNKDIKIDINDFIMVINSLKATAFHQLVKG